MLVAVMILVLGLELVQGSWDKIVRPEAISFSAISRDVVGFYFGKVLDVFLQ